MLKFVKSILCVFGPAQIILFVSATLLAAESPNGIVTITFDDGSRSQYEYGLRLAVAHGVSGTIFIPTALATTSSAQGGQNWELNWNEIREFHDAGWEIGAHGRSHLRMTELGPVELATEIEGPILDIKQHIGVEPVSFSSPFGAFDNETILQIMDSYKFNVSWKGQGGRNTIDTVDPRYIGRFEVVNSMSSAQVCGEMVLAAQSSTWLVLLFHSIVENNPQDYEISAQKYEEILACAVFLEQNNIIQIATVRQAMAAIKAQN